MGFKPRPPKPPEEKVAHFLINRSPLGWETEWFLCEATRLSPRETSLGLLRLMQKGEVVMTANQYPPMYQHKNFRFDWDKPA